MLADAVKSISLYQFTLIDPLLAEGELSMAEREQIHRYIDNLFTENWGLKPGNIPYFVSPSGEEETGSAGWR